MKTYLEIKSKGEIDVEAFTLIGASTKRNDSSKIGLYGSGNKYSIATLLKQSIDFKIFSGQKEIVFTTKKQSFRNESFDVILVNGTETSLTTTMGGLDWENAFAPIREIYSNALDEDENATIKEKTECSPVSGFTTFYIEMNDDVKHFFDNIHLYFCNHNKKVLFSNGKDSVFENTDNGNVRIFRKGILSHLDNTKKSVFHYNIDNIDINESRVIKYVWQIESKVGCILKSINNPSVVSLLLHALNGGSSGYLEHKSDYSNIGVFSDAWKEACSDKKFVPVEFSEMFNEDDLRGRYQLPMSLLKALKLQFEDLDVLGLSSKSEVNFIEVEPNQILLNKVIDAVSLLKSTNYNYRLTDINIRYVKFLKANILGLAEDGNIFLSTKLDTYSIDEVAKVIIEENEHNLTGFSDETREFQNHLFNLYFEQLKN